MLKILGPQKRFRTSLYQCLCQFADDVKTKKDEGEPSTPLEKTSEKLPSTIKKPVTVKTTYNPKEITKDDLVWRTPWHQKEGQRYTTLRTFYEEDSNISVLKWIQTPINLSPEAMKKWWIKRKQYREAYLQQYIPERHEALGPELATAHFIVHRGGAVKFHNEDKWIKAVDGDYQLPTRYQKDMFLQAIDCTDMRLHYEGLDNLRDLRNVEWLSLNGCQFMDDFCIDVISNIFSHSLLYLDLRNCFEITENGIGALYKMRHLRILYLDDLLKDTKYELTGLLLQDLNPNLDIRSDVINFEIK